MSPDKFRERWTRTFEDGKWSVTKFRKQTFATETCTEGFRSLCWKVYLEVLPGLDLKTWKTALNKSRVHYGELRKKLIDIPRETLSHLQQEADHARVNPLAPDNDNPWTQYFQDGELRKVIVQDVERTFPDLELFRKSWVQTLMTDVLFVYCKLYATNSYRQGMHELLAPMVFVLEADANVDTSGAPSSDEGKAMQTALDATFIEHDSFTLFERLMNGAGPWFEAPGPDEAARLARAHKARNQTSLIRALNYPPKSSTPILALCYQLYYTHLAACDPPLFSHLERLEIEPQLFGLRWFRLLFSREMPFSSAIKVWDGILNYSSDLKLAEFVALALLLFLRDQIVDQDYSTTLQCLMRPPKLHSPHILLRQAAQLAAQPDATTGYQIALENYKIKGIHPAMLPPFPTEITENAPSKLGRGRTNSTGNMPTTAKKASPSTLAVRPNPKPIPKPKTDVTPINLSQVAELDSQLILGLEQCIKWIESEPGHLCKSAAEGLQGISAALKGRAEVLGGQPFKGDHRFGFPPPALASVFDKEEPWEIITKPENESARATSKSIAQDTSNNAHLSKTSSLPSQSQSPLTKVPDQKPPQISPKKARDQNPAQVPIQDTFTQVSTTDENKTIKPSITESTKNPIHNSKSKYLPESNNRIAPVDQATLPSSPKSSETKQSLVKRLSISEPPDTTPVQSTKSQEILVEPKDNLVNTVTPSKPLTPTKPPKVKVDNKKLKQVREQYDWIFGSSDQSKPQKTKTSKSVSAPSEKKLGFASHDPLSVQPGSGNAEDFLSTLRTPPRSNTKKIDPISSSFDNLPVSHDLSSNFGTTVEIGTSVSEPDLWSTSPQDNRPSSPTAPSSVQPDFIEASFSSIHDGFEINKPLINPPRPPDDFFSNPW